MIVFWLKYMIIPHILVKKEEKKIMRHSFIWIIFQIRIRGKYWN